MGCFLTKGGSPVVLEVEKNLLDVGRSVISLKYLECQYELVTMVKLLLTMWGIIIDHK